MYKNELNLGKAVCFWSSFPGKTIRWVVFIPLAFALLFLIEFAAYTVFGILFENAVGLLILLLIFGVGISMFIICFFSYACVLSLSLGKTKHSVVNRHRILFI